MDVQKTPGWALKLPSFKRLKIFGGAILASIALLTAGGSVGVERRTPTHQIEQAESAEDFLVRVSREIERMVGSPEFIHRFTKIGSDGGQEFNPEGLLFPISVGITSEQDVTLAVQLSIPFDWARTFTEIQRNDPARAREMEQELVTELQKQIPNGVVMHGIPGLTNSTAVWNANGRELAIADDGSIVPPSGSSLSAENVSITGSASDEARASNVESLGGADAENVTLAENRSENLMPTIRRALEQAGIDLSKLKDIQIEGIEHHLTPQEIQALGEIAGKQERFARLGGVTEEWAMRTVYAYNHGEPLDLTPEDTALLQRVLNDERRVDVTVRATGTETTFRTFNIGVFLPLLALLAPIGRTVGGTKRKAHYVETLVSIEEIKHAAVARRIFSETTPTRLNEERDFNAIYDSIDLSVGHQDFQRMQQHILIEEMLPSLNPATQEPYIDYLQIANESLPYMHSDTNEGRTIRKGRYPTSEEAQREVALKLLRMWELHDQAVYPMSGSPLGPIDVKKVLNYEHSEEVVKWAKLLAEQFVAINKALYEKKRETADPIVTRDEFETALRERISANAAAAERDSYVRRNVFVVSEQPDGGEYKARVNSY